MFKRAMIVATFFIPTISLADTQCGNFLLSSGFEDGLFRVNGIKPETQKITFLKGKEDYDNIMVQWMVERGSEPGWFGMEYVKRNGKAVLNVEAIRSNMDQPRVFGSFDCVRIK
ncbi:hypothetical protein SMB94_003931 [Cronobacter sakazakii]|nr:hypothetical protein [Cronobacter sakazakii]ELY2540604.1 hypothetical protein [Cronobacter sakazakii]ELY4823282.1 hypothetical protein [Cronobacter sakazakii]ELY4839640.1 hypothetical protein [Cronobacter sakazakii]ELY5865294.1 hypothetical protein [Cronobacter sakazakii]